MVVSVTDQSGEARYPSFKGIMAAKKKPVESLDLDDLGIDADEVGLGGAWTAVDSAAARPARTAGTIVKDEGEGGKALAGFPGSTRSSSEPRAHSFVVSSFNRRRLKSHG